MDICEPSTKRVRHDLEKSSHSLGEVERTKNSNLLKDANDAISESSKRYVKPTIDEASFGIELFVGNSSDGFHGLIKSRYADFIVHEIDLDGRPAILDNLEPPEEASTANQWTLKDFLDDETLTCLREVSDGYVTSYKIDVSDMDKEKRTYLHHAIRDAFDRLESSTITESVDSSEDTESQKKLNNESEGALRVGADSETSTVKTTHERRYIVVTKRHKGSRAKNLWPRDRPDHTYFILYKENRDTMDAINRLAAVMNMRPLNFSFAGTKDKRAVTTQWVSCWHLEPKKLIHATKRFNKRPFLKVGNFFFRNSPLKLGHLQGNRFDVVIRHLVYDKESLRVVERSMASIEDKGFINYFGMQRFGTRSIRTYEVGLAILLDDWERAVDLILSYRYDDRNLLQMNFSTRPGMEEQTDIQKPASTKPEPRNQNNDAFNHNSFIDMWKSKLDADLVFKKYPNFKHTNEAHIMKSLSKNGCLKFFEAITSLPRTTRSMYVHSYQSLLWNKVTSYRLRRYGYDVIQGDLVSVCDKSISIDDSILISGEKSLEESIHNEEIKEDLECPSNSSTSNVIVVDEANCRNYTIFDVVLPLVGSRIRLPENEVGSRFLELLSDDGLTLDNFKSHEGLFASYGSYRKIMVKPKDLKWSVRLYSNPHKNLVDTDLDLLNKNHASDSASGNDYASAPKSDSSDEALIVSFQLPPSSYATMCLREIMKKNSTTISNT